MFDYIKRRGYQKIIEPYINKKPDKRLATKALLLHGANYG